MQYEAFKKEFSEVLIENFERTGQRVEVFDHKYSGTNKQMDGVIFRLENSSLAPTIHMNAMYDRWKGSEMSIRDLAENVSISIREEYAKITALNFPEEKFTSQYIKEHAYLSVVNTEMNVDLLKNIPHEEIKGTDLSAFVKVDVGNNATITITNELAYMLRMTKGELLDVARENTLEQGHNVRSMENVLKDIMSAEFVEEMQLFPEGENPNMVVISNETGYEGTNAILSKDALDEACKELGASNITIIPSSRHELLAVNTERIEMSVEELKEMVKEVNGTEVLLEDQLSNNVYQYNGINHKLEIGNEQELQEECNLSIETHGIKMI